MPRISPSPSPSQDDDTPVPGLSSDDTVDTVPVQTASASNMTNPGNTSGNAAAAVLEEASVDSSDPNNGCTCPFLDGEHGVDAPCPLAKPKGVMMPVDKSTYREDAVISRLFNYLPEDRQLIITRAQRPVGVGPPPYKPEKPVVKSPETFAVMMPVGHLCEDHPPRNFQGGMRARGGNMAFLRLSVKDSDQWKVTYVDSTGQACNKSFIWYYQGFSEAEVLPKLKAELLEDLEQLKEENAAKEVQYQRDTLDWEQRAFRAIESAGKLAGIPTMSTREASRDERLRNLVSLIQAERFEREEVMEVLGRLFPTKSGLPKGNPKRVNNAQKGKDAKAASRLPEELEHIAKKTASNSKSDNQASKKKKAKDTTSKTSTKRQKTVQKAGKPTRKTTARKTVLSPSLTAENEGDNPDEVGSLADFIDDEAEDAELDADEQEESESEESSGSNDDE